MKAEPNPSKSDHSSHNAILIEVNVYAATRSASPAANAADLPAPSPALAYPIADSPLPDSQQQARTAEAHSLLKGLEARALETLRFNVSKVLPATLLGRGAIEQISERIAQHERAEGSKPDFAFFDTSLSPVQQRNLEDTLGLKIIDRTQIILMIFAARARTHEGRIQVELAQQVYARSRLVRTWTHLERQRGGTASVGGMGEKQLEIDRRLADRRIDVLRNRLAKIRASRLLHRRRRNRRGTPVVVLTGYTNAGKSTLFSRVSKADTLVDDRVFATLDPTVRNIRVHGSKNACLIDTVGFIADLPTALVASFHATLEEIVDADLILHVHDVSHDGWHQRLQQVDATLQQLGVDPLSSRVVHVLNKVDKVAAGVMSSIHAAMQERAAQQTICPLSAVSGEGIAALMTTIGNKVYPANHRVAIQVPASVSGKVRAWLYGNATVISERVNDEGKLYIDARIAAMQLSALQGKWSEVVITAAVGGEMPLPEQSRHHHSTT